MDDLLRVRRMLPAHPSSVGVARRAVRDVLDAADRPDLVETAELVVSEVVTNAVIHGGTQLDFLASVNPAGLRVEVGDGATRAPERRDYEGLAGTGRGLVLVEQLVDRWGVAPRRAGKTVWFELESGESAGSAPREDDARAAPAPAPGVGAETLEVVLLNVPLLLHSAWQMQCESIIREYLLSQFDGESDATAAIESNAAASDALALLQAQIPEPDLGEAPEEVMAAATEPYVTRERVTLRVPRTAVANFDRLDRTLDAALALADAGAFLTAPTQPELRLLRRWFCEEVRRQGRGDSPSPWSLPPEVLPAPGELPPGGETHPASQRVSQATGALIAADDSNRIVAVSPAAAELLGYGSAGQLVGRRLIEIVPARYRQAHLAGFTLHLASGRRPLIGRPVTVPALHRDGTEVLVELTIAASPAVGGRHLFIAEMTPAPARAGSRPRPPR